ncbi:DUF58 domain-containing protein [Galbibacter sp. EGI 63066]|uniref:DUF58 domain-containing protein n=1 Tax=Galbibacter sp. EGI 63066 TaxID=2993559 RepID=UPI00224930FB|nr:DUF58 domain-containing protein [Galbibacter sp. EGI 63066]MCX2678988.1 DUF58 domain-containing protein [Galbibacter sp. EGI 63066]
MKQDYHQLLKSEIINSVSGLALIARVTVDGYLAGHNNSRRIGSGMEFSQYSHYQPGDDLRLLDWKMLARSEKYYIKQSEVETNVTVKFVLDSSKSMLHEENGLSKMDYVKVLVASIAYLANSQKDEIGLYALNEHRVDSLNPKVNKQHFNYFLHRLISIQSDGTFPDITTALQEVHTRSQKELVFFITDLYEYNQELTSIIKGMKTVRNEVIVLHVMGKSELEFDYKGSVTFQDLETGERLKVDAKTAREHYLKSLGDMVNAMKKEFLANNIGYHLFRLDTHIGEVLQLFLKKRSRM